MTTSVRQAIAESISPELVREACEEAKARSGGRTEEFYVQLAMALKRRVAAPEPEGTAWAVILAAADGGIRAVLSTKAPRFLEPRGMHDDVATGAKSVWFSLHHEDEIAPFASREAAQRGLDAVVAAIAEPGLGERLRIVPAHLKGQRELLVHLSADVALPTPAPAPAKSPFLSTQVFKAFVNPAKPD